MSLSCVLGATTVVIGLAIGFPPQQADHDKAIAAIRKLGGSVEFAKGKPGQPLTVALFFPPANEVHEQVEAYFAELSGETKMLEVNAINLHYGAAQALRGVSLTAEPGKVTCVLGRNGVGKTSLLRALVGQHAISGGSITFGGSEISRLPPHDRARRGIAYVPQGREIFPQEC